MELTYPCRSALERHQSEADVIFTGSIRIPYGERRGEGSSAPVKLKHKQDLASCKRVNSGSCKTDADVSAAERPRSQLKRESRAAN